MLALRLSPIFSSFFIAAISVSPLVFADKQEKNAQRQQQQLINHKFYADCLAKQIRESPDDRPIRDIETFCAEQIVKKELNVDQVGALGQKVIGEKQAEGNRHVIYSHRQNYVLPFAHSNNVNKEAYEALGSWSDDFHHGEAIFQMSYKVALNEGDLLRKFDNLYFGMTLKSWWQVYAKESSRQFRETNYEPELFYLAPLAGDFFDGNLSMVLGAVHQSNGRSQLLSRSWNRIYLGFIYEEPEFVLSLRPWYRIPEKDKRFPGDAEGDDNPDIDKYMGNFDLTAVKRFGGNELTVLFRNNLRSENKGAIEISYSFPFPKSHLKGFVQYFNGYGESLIDYNHQQERLGIGILLTDLL